MNNQKVIMENWRRFLKENQEPQLSEVQKAFQEIGLNEEQLDEGWLAKLGGMAALAMSLASTSAEAGTPLTGVESTSGHEISFQMDGDGVSVKDVSNSLKQLAAHGKAKGDQQLVKDADAAAGELANIMKDVNYAATHDIGADTDGDGLGDNTVMGPIEFSETLQAAVDHAAGPQQPDVEQPSDNVGPDANGDGEVSPLELKKWQMQKHDAFAPMKETDKKT